MKAKPATLEGIRPVPIVDVYQVTQDRLKHFIVENRLSAGDRLPAESDLAEALGISRPALREALRALEALGTIESKVGSGWYVRAFSLNSITQGLAYGLELSEYSFIDLSRVRIGLECGFVDDALRVLTPATLQALEEAISGMEETARNGEGLAYTQYDRDFHCSLFSDLNNSLLKELLEVFWNLYDYLYPSADFGSDLIKDAHRHRLILDAIKSGDADLARKRLRESTESGAYPGVRK